MSTNTKDDFAYGTQRMVHLIHEPFLVFLADGMYYDYRVARLGLDHDWA